jgi:hypothetical protein
MNARKITYWISTALVAAVIAISGVLSLVHSPSMVKAFVHLAILLTLAIFLESPRCWESVSCSPWLGHHQGMGLRGNRYYPHQRLRVSLCLGRWPCIARTTVLLRHADRIVLNPHYWTLSVSFRDSTRFAADFAT